MATRTNHKIWDLAYDMFKWDLLEDGAFDDVDPIEAWEELGQSARNQYYDDALVAMKQEGNL